MLTMLILYSIMSTTILFMQTSHPLAMGLTILIQTINVCLFTGTLTPTFWFSYILFLVFIGGMMVLFIYITSISSNEMFNLSLNTLTILMMSMLLMMVTMMNTDMNILSSMMEKLNNLYDSHPPLMMEYTTSLQKMFNYPTHTTTIMLVIYLLITLIAVVKLTNIKSGPLRPMN